MNLWHGVAWFDLTVPRTEECYGWHFCVFEADHEGAHLCRGGHFCAQSDQSNPPSTMDL